MKSISLRSLISLLTVFLPFCTDSQTWTSITGPWDGSIDKITCDSGNPSTLYAGGRNGVYRSTDNGLSWVQVSASQVSYLSESVMYPTNVFSEGEWTNDAGASWRPYTLPESYIYDMALDPNSGGVIYALSSSKLYISGDFGASWSVCDDSTGRWPYYCRDVKVGKSPQGIVYTVGDNGYLRKSTDHGTTWKGLSYANNSSGSGWALEIDPFNANILYFGRGDTLFKSSNGGSNWMKTKLPSTENSALAINRSNANTLYVAFDAGLLKSTDGGSSFTQISSNQSRENVTSLVCLANGYVVKGTYSQGIYLSTDGGITFRSVGVEQVQARGMKFQNSDNTIIAWNSNGLYSSLDGGNTWQLKLAVGTYSRNGLAMDPSIQAHWVFATGSTSNMTTDNGASWTQSSFAASNSVSEVFFAPSNSSVLYTGSTASRSSDGGTHWSLITEPIPGVSATTLRVSPSNPNLLLANANSCLAVVRSDDGGQHWYTFQDGIQSTVYGVGFSDMVFDPLDPSTVYMTNGGLYKLTSPGTVWTRIYDNAANPNAPYYVGTLLIDPTDDQKMYSYLTGCVLIGSSNGGVTWGLASSGIPDYFKSASNAFMGSTGRVYLSTGAGFIWGSPAISNAVANGSGKRQTSNLLGQNYPNPANPETNIPITLAKSGHVSLKLFDILGREVMTLLNEERQAGDLTVRLATSNLASGVYVYRVEAGDYVDAKRLTVLR